jgi:hypothetical protein
VFSSARGGVWLMPTTAKPHTNFLLPTPLNICSLCGILWYEGAYPCSNVAIPDGDVVGGRVYGQLHNEGDQIQHSRHTCVQQLLQQRTHQCSAVQCSANEASAPSIHGFFWGGKIKIEKRKCYKKLQSFVNVVLSLFYCTRDLHL